VACRLNDILCEVDALDMSVRVGVEDHPRVDPGTATDIENVLRMDLGDRLANERGDERSGGQRDLRDVVRVPGQIRSPFTGIGTQQLVERPVRTDLVLEHRTVVGTQEAVAVGQCPRPAPAHAEHLPPS
jgi:hypothetical protein